MTAAPVPLEPGRRALFADVDDTLFDRGEPGEGAAELADLLRRAGAALVLTTGRGLAMSLAAGAALAAAGLPRPAALVCGVGSEVHVWRGGGYVLDQAWERRLATSGFDAAAVREAVSDVPGLKAQPESAQGPYKVSWFVAGPHAAAEAERALASAGMPARLSLSAGSYLDALPLSASKGAALLHLVGAYGLQPEDVAAAGDSGNDRELLLEAAAAGMTAVLAHGYRPELEDLPRHPRVLVAHLPHGAGVAEALAVAGWA